MKKLKLTTVHLDQIHPNPWNPNKQTPRSREALRESIETYGYIDPMTVRAHPDIEGEWQLIDGEHRLEEARSVDLVSVEVVVLELSDYDAKKLTIILNETRGSADSVELAFLLKDLADATPAEASLITGLPYTEAELADLVRMADTDWAAYGAPARTPPASDEEEWTTIVCRVPVSVRDLWKDAFERHYAESPPHPNRDVANGLLVEVMVAEYLAGVTQ